MKFILGSPWLTLARLVRFDEQRGRDLVQVSGDQLQHIRGALNNGLSREEIREVLLQVGIYGGIPATVDSFRLANEAFAEIDSEAQEKLD